MKRNRTMERNSRQWIYGTSEWPRQKRWLSVSRSGVNNCISCEWLEKKTEVPNLLCRCGTSGNGCLSRQHQAEGRDNSVWESWWEDARRKKQVNTSHENIKRWKFTRPILGVGSEKVPYTRCNCVKTKSTTENHEENSRSVSFLAFSSWYVVSLCPCNAVDSTLIFSFFLPATTTKSS